VLSSTDKLSAEEIKSGAYISAGISNQSPTEEQYGKLKNYNLAVGYSLNNNWSIESEFVGTYEKASKSINYIYYQNYETNTSLNANYNSKFSSNKYSVYGVYTSSGKIYFESRVGFSKTNYEVETSTSYEGNQNHLIWVGEYRFNGASYKLTTGSNGDSASFSVSALSAGVGVGYRENSYDVKLGITKLNDEIGTKNISVVLKYWF
jgi:hypothetical protein